MTVDRKVGSFYTNEQSTGLIDLPGIYSFDANSVDEKITRNHLLFSDALLIINVLG